MSQRSAATRPRSYLSRLPRTVRTGEAMNDSHPTSKRWRGLRDLRVIVALTSVAFSLWSIVQDPVINVDGTLYIQAAARFAAGDWGAGFALYNWPFYSLVIAAISTMTGFGLEASAHVLNTLSFVAICVTFVTIIQRLGGDRKVMIAAALLILFYSHLNEQRSSVIRDPSYLAFYLLAVLLFLQYQRTPTWPRAVGWGLAMGVATLFRMEGVVLLVLLPLVLFIDGSRTFGVRCRVFLKAHVVLVALCCGLLVLRLVASDSDAWKSIAGSRLGELDVLLGAFRRIVTQTLPHRADVLATTLLDGFSAPYAPAVIVITMGVIVFWESLSVLTELNALLVVLAIVLCRGLFGDRRARWMWITCIFLNVLILIFIVVINFHLTGRSGFALALTLLVAAPFGLAKLYEDWIAHRRDRRLRALWFPVICIWLAIAACDGLVSFGPGKNHIRQAGLWVRQNVPEAARFFTNNSLVAHYAEREFHRLPVKDARESALSIIRSGEWKRYETFAIRIRRRDERLESIYRDALRREPVQVFRNGAGDRVAIFQARGASR